MQELFALPKIMAKHVPGLASRMNIDANTLVTPALEVLPTGWNRSLHIAQLCHEQQVISSGVREQDLTKDRRPSVCLHEPGTRSAGYVDNNLQLSQDKGSVEETSARVHEHLESLNLPTHELTGTVELADFVGLSFDGTRHEVRTSWKRVWRLRLAMLHVLGKDRISGKALEQILGHATWSCLLRCEALSIINSTYSFCLARCHKECTLWPSVRRELRQKASLLPVLVALLDLDWNDVVSV